MTLTKYVKNFGLPFLGQEDFRECYLAADVDARIAALGQTILANVVDGAAIDATVIKNSVLIALQQQVATLTAERDEAIGSFNDAIGRESVLMNQVAALEQIQKIDLQNNNEYREQVATLKARIADLEHCVTGQGERLHDYCRKYAALVAERDRMNTELAHWREAARSVGETDGHGWAQTTQHLRTTFGVAIARARAEARAEGRREERDAWMRKFPVAIPPGGKERPEQGEQCPSCYAVRATWITGCTNPIHPKEGV